MKMYYRKILYWIQRQFKEKNKLTSEYVAIKVNKKMRTKKNKNNFKWDYNNGKNPKKQSQLSQKSIIII